MEAARRAPLASSAPSRNGVPPKRAQLVGEHLARRGRRRARARAGSACGRPRARAPSRRSPRAARPRRPRTTRSTSIRPSAAPMRPASAAFSRRASPADPTRARRSRRARHCPRSGPGSAEPQAVAARAPASTREDRPAGLGRPRGVPRSKTTPIPGRGSSRRSRPALRAARFDQPPAGGARLARRERRAAGHRALRRIRRDHDRVALDGDRPARAAARGAAGTGPPPASGGRRRRGSRSRSRGCTRRGAPPRRPAARAPAAAAVAAPPAARRYWCTAAGHVVRALQPALDLERRDAQLRERRHRAEPDQILRARAGTRPRRGRAPRRRRSSSYGSRHACAHWPRFAERPPHASDDRHCPDHATHSAPWTNTSSGRLVPAAYARISSSDSSRGTTTRPRPELAQELGGERATRRHLRRACSSSAGHTARAIRATAGSWTMIASAPDAATRRIELLDDRQLGLEHERVQRDVTRARRRGGPTRRSRRARPTEVRRARARVEAVVEAEVHGVGARGEGGGERRRGRGPGRGARISGRRKSGDGARGGRVQGGGAARATRAGAAPSPWGEPFRAAFHTTPKPWRPSNTFFFLAHLGSPMPLRRGGASI